MKLTSLYEIIFHMQDSSKFYTYWFALSAIYISEGPVVRRLISANPRLNFNLNFFIPLFKCLFRIVSGVLYRASNNHIRDKKNPTEFSLKAIRSEIRFHTNPGLS